MSFISHVSDFFELLFFGSNPEVLKKRELRKIESELRSYFPPLLRNRTLMPAFAEALYVLFQNTRPIFSILDETLLNPTSNVAANYIDLLISTGFSYEDLSIVKACQYQERKDALRTTDNEKREFDRQRHQLDKLVKDIKSSPQMEQIELVLSRLMQLYDICAYEYTKFLGEFAPPGSTITELTHAQFTPIRLADQEQKLLDLYYIVSDFTITTSLAKALIALSEHKNASSLPMDEQNRITDCLKKISGVLSKVVTPSILRNMLCIIKYDPKVEPAKNNYAHNFIDEYINRTRQMFDADEQRILNELKDERLQADLNEVFMQRELVTVNGYNNDSNVILQKTSTQMFMWTTPLQILKSFMHYYFTEGIQSLLNDIEVEGIFGNVNTQKAFGNCVYRCSEITQGIKEFEALFGKDAENDFSSIARLAANSKNNPDLTKQLISRVSKLNSKARALLQTNMHEFSKMTRTINDILVDAKKGSPEMVSNIKLIMFTTRHKEHTAFLDTSIHNWFKFIELMKNYVIFSDKE